MDVINIHAGYFNMDVIIIHAGIIVNACKYMGPNHN